MSRVAILIAWVSLVATAQLCAAQSPQDAKQLRALVKQSIKPQFDDVVLKFRELSKNKDPHYMADAIDGIKAIFYNKAYALYQCVKSFGYIPPSTDRDAKMEECFQKKTAAIVTSYKIATQYDAYLSRNGQKETQCELRARLFDAEIEFPPFDFLQRSDGNNALYNFDLMNSCFRSINP